MLAPAAAPAAAAAFAGRMAEPRTFAARFAAGLSRSSSFAFNRVASVKSSWTLDLHLSYASCIHTVGSAARTAGLSIQKLRESIADGGSCDEGGARLQVQDSVVRSVLCLVRPR